MSKANAVGGIAARIFEIRGRKVMLDRDLAELYGVGTRILNQAVKRNIKRFPEDFMFQISWEELEYLISQSVISSSRSQFVILNSRSQNATLKQGKNIKYLPYVFTEQGVAMLSSVLSSERAIQVNILIVRAFTKLREILLTHKDLAAKVEALERKYSEHDETIKAIFAAVKRLLAPPPVKRKRIIGFQVEK
jgi:phage regulator Rha-like protein